MAKYSKGVNDAETVKLWSKRLFHETLHESYFGKFMGEGSENMIQVIPDTNKSAGDRVTCTLRMLLSGAGIQGDSTMEGNEEAIVTYTDNILINQLRHSVRTGGKMTEQRVPFSVREESYQGLRDWWTDRFDTSMMNQLAGYTVQTDTRYTGNNATITADTSHIIRAGTAGTDASLVTANVFNLNLLDSAIEKAKTLSPSIRPVRTGMGEMYVVFLHPYQVYDLRTSTTSLQWADIQKAAMQGGKIKDNPIFTGALGVYNNCVLHSSARIPQGVNGAAAQANTRRAVFCGAQSASIAFGKGFSEGKFFWREELFDYGNQLGVGAGTIFGMKKCQFNSTDFGTIVISTYAASH